MPYKAAKSCRRCGASLSTNFLPILSTSRRTSSNKAKAAESKRFKFPASSTTSACAWPDKSFDKAARQATALACVITSGNTSMSTFGRHGVGSGVGLVALNQRGDQAIKAFGVNFLCKLATVGFYQPDAQHVEVVNFPASADTRCFFKPVVQLHRITAPRDQGAHNHFLVIRRGPQGFDAKTQVSGLAHGTGIG